MSTNPQADYLPESRLQNVPVESLVHMAKPGHTFIDGSGNVLGLGKDNLADLKLPVFQRGLKWNDERLEEFHNSLIQGWPIGLLVIATESSRLLDKSAGSSGQREFKLSLIDGQQRTWALSRLVGEFWSKPWFVFSNPKWDNGGTPVGSIISARDGLIRLAKALSVSTDDLYDAVVAISRKHGRDGFDDYVDFLKRVTALLGLKSTTKTEARQASKVLTEAILRQYADLNAVTVHVLVLDETLKAQQPSIFKRLNSGVPLKGYDLLAATWEHERLLRPTASPAERKFLKDVLDIAETRIRATYSDAGSGYVYEPNIEPLTLEDLSLFDLLYYMGSSIAVGSTYNINSDVLAFQVAALVFNGNINKVDDNLRKAFPTRDGGPDIADCPKLFAEAGRNVAAALKPMMDVTSKGVALRGRVSLTPSAVYIASFLTHHNRVVRGSGSHLTLKRRGAASEDRILTSGVSKTANQRMSLLKETLPAWFVHDSLTSIFAGSRAYEAANNRVWAPAVRGRRLTPSNAMLEFPALDDLMQAFRDLWDSEMAIQKTPQRRRISDAGSILFRAAFCHLTVHDTVIDHVIPLALGRASANAAGQIYPLNHVANLMPLDEVINNNRKDEEWAVFRPRLIPSQEKQVKASLLVPWDATSSSCLVDRDTFILFLAKRYRALVKRALSNLQVPDWQQLDATEKSKLLGGLVGG